MNFTITFISYSQTLTSDKYQRKILRKTFVILEASAWLFYSCHTCGMPFV